MSNRPPASQREASSVLAAVAVTVALGVAAALIVSELAAGMFRPWNDVRLAPSAGLLRGHPLYVAADGAGAIWSWIYGPVAPLIYLPAAAAATPALSVGFALAWTAAIYLAAARGLLRVTSVARGSAFEAAFAALVLYSLINPALRGAGFWIHADAPALGFAALACAAVATPARRSRPTARALSAIASVLAVATKQVLLPLPVVLGLYFAATAGRRATWQWMGVALATTLAVGMASIAAFGADPLVFNLITIPLAHPWQWEGGLTALARAAVEWAGFALPLAAVLSLDVRRLHAARASGHRVLDDPRGLLLLVALALSLAGLVTRVKVGAGLNAHAFGLFFGAVAAAGVLADAASDRSKLARAVLGLGLAAAIALTLPTLTGLPAQLRSLPENPETTGLALARSAPDAVWFPDHPLLTLHTTGRATHVSYGLFDRELAGHRVPDAAFRAFTAPELDRVALWAAQYDPALTRLPKFRARQPYGPQPGWQLIVPAAPARETDQPTHATHGDR